MLAACNCFNNEAESISRYTYHNKPPPSPNEMKYFKKVFIKIGYYKRLSSLGKTKVGT